MCPTMFSVMKIGTCRLPSCTAMVRPSMSGMIVDARAHVLITACPLLACIRSTLRASLGCTYGPFLVDLDMLITLRILSVWHTQSHRRSAFSRMLTATASSSNDKFAAVLLFVTGSVSKSRLAPRRLRAGHSDWGAPLAAAVRMVSGRHYNSAHLRPATLITPLSRFSKLDILMVEVAYLTKGRHALTEYIAHLSRW